MKPVISTIKDIYPSSQAEAQKQRYKSAVTAFAEHFGSIGEHRFFSAPGRTEICGNHTDHNHGKVFAASVNLDVIAVVEPTEDDKIVIKSEGFPEDSVDLSQLAVVPEEKNTSASLIRGVAAGFEKEGMKIGGFRAYTTSDVMKGSGLSSSAAFEVLVGTILSHLYNGGQVSAVKIAQISQFAENVYFGKPCGLMDQMASSVGGLVAIDFKAEPKVTPLQYDFSARGYSLIVVNTGGSHDDLTEEYGAIRSEMNKVAHCFGEETLRRVRPEQLWQEMPRVRREAGDRALLRALHYYNENDRVHALVNAVKADQIDEIKRILIESGRSSWMYLQNVYAKNSPEQPLCVALSMAEYMLHDCGAYRVHGGGFAGTTLNLVPQSQEERFLRHMRQMFGDKSCYVLSVRPEGATLVF